MAARLRVFVSSTMLDLENERDAVVQSLRSANFEPINAENFGAIPANSWSAIKAKITEADVFALILGESYGFVPSSGPGSAGGVSVTEMEFNEAKSQRKPVIVFTKQLRYSSAERTPDAIRRDDFRRRVREWGDGYFTAEFSLARELGDLVAAAVVDLLTDRYRRSTSSSVIDLFDPREGTPITASGDVALPEGLRQAISGGDSILLVGAGLSMSAGLPSWNAFSSILARDIRVDLPDYAMDDGAFSYNAVASDYEDIFGRSALVAAAKRAVEPVWLRASTTLHAQAIAQFGIIVSTNYDNLLERAAAEAGSHFEIFLDDLPTDELIAPCTIIKLHGSIDKDDSLVLTDGDRRRLAESRPHFATAFAREILRRPVVAIGTSLTDPSVTEFFASRAERTERWVVAPQFSSSEDRRARRLGFTPVALDAATFLALSASAAMSPTD